MENELMENGLIETYRHQANDLSLDLYEGRQEKHKLIQLIEETRQKALTDPAYQEFFTAEKAFYAGHYELALKHYLQANSIPDQTFFCFRASAHLFYTLNQLEKAQHFTEKALKISPQDHSLLILCNQLEQDQNKLGKEEASSSTFSLNDEHLTKNKDCKEFDQQILTPFNENSFLINSELEKTNPLNSASSYATTREFSMNTESAIFSSPKSLGSSQTQVLTERLYPLYSSSQLNDPYLIKNPYTSFSNLNHIQEKQALSFKSSFNEIGPTNHFIAQELGTNQLGNEKLEKCIKNFHLIQEEQLCLYLAQGKARVQLPDFALYYLNGWQVSSSLPHLHNLTFMENALQTTGGIFLRWNGKGLAINPGTHFLEQFHQKGLHISDIDFVIVTDAYPESYANVKEIYDLNYQLNKVNTELQIITYYFHHQAFQELSRFLKPHFRQERHSLHNLELFDDSPDVEKIELAEGFTLNYFLASASGERQADNQANGEKKSTTVGFGIRLDLRTLDLQANEKTNMRLGYLTHTPWHPLLAHYLGSCDILITGFGHTVANDYNKISYSTDCLGYYGTFTLAEEVLPRLLLCGEFSSRDGDIRLEVIQKMRTEFIDLIKNARHLPVILPASRGLLINLKNLQLKCPISQEWIEAKEAKVVKTAHSFGPLHYLSTSCCC